MAMQEGEKPIVVCVLMNAKEIDQVVAAIEPCCSLTLPYRECQKVGPIKIFQATKAIEAVSRMTNLHERHDACHGLILGWQFTYKQREAYCDSLLQVMKEKFPTVPVVLMGVPKKANPEVTDYHTTMEWCVEDGSEPIAELLIQLKHGEVDTTHWFNGKPTDPNSKSKPAKRSEVEQRTVGGSHAHVHSPKGSQSPRGSLDIQKGSARAPSVLSGYAPGMDMGSLSCVQSPGSNMGMMSPLSPGGYMPGGMVPAAQLYSTPMAAMPVPAALPAANNTPNAEIIQSLANEVARLQMKVAEKRAREAAAAQAQQY